MLPSPKLEGGSQEDQVIELPNRSRYPRDTYEIWGDDLRLELAPWVPRASREEQFGVVVWHSHPNGGLGPSRGDMQSRVAGATYLVVTLNADGSVTPTWF